MMMMLISILFVKHVEINSLLVIVFGKNIVILGNIKRELQRNEN